MSPVTRDAGRELDALVAEKVMGWKPCVTQDHPGWVYFDSGAGGGKIAPAFSTDIAAAWEVVEKLSPRYAIRILNDATPGPSWCCEMAHGYGNDIEVEAETAPLAICRAALEAIEVRGGPAQ